MAESVGGYDFDCVGRRRGRFSIGMLARVLCVDVGREVVVTLEEEEKGEVFCSGFCQFDVDGVWCEGLDTLDCVS